MAGMYVSVFAIGSVSGVGFGEILDGLHVVVKSPRYQRAL